VLVVCIAAALTAACGADQEAPPDPWIETIPASEPTARESPTPPIDDTPAVDESDVVSAAGAYARANSAEGSVSEVVLDAEQDGFARLRVVPRDENQEGAIIFMKQDGARWTALGMGTSFPCAELAAQGMPEELCRDFN
jgi:hypothetical protein